MAGHRQNVLTLVLERSPIEVGGSIRGRVIVAQPVDEREVQTRDAAAQVDREIGAVGHQPVHVHGQGRRQRMGQSAEQPAR